MPSQQKLIKQGIRYTDSLFDEVIRRVNQGVKSTDTLESFLNFYNNVFPEKGNPLIALGYDVEMINLILQETNNHKFSRPAQKELTRVTIEQYVGEKIVDVGDDIRESVRDIVRDGYDNSLSQDEIAANISSKVTGIKNRRARAIARTEIARTATVSDYVINAERGATHFYVECRNTACSICKEAWLTNPDKTPTGKGMEGDKYYPMNRTDKLPPLHPNCRCVPYFVNEEDKGVNIVNEQPTAKVQTPTVEKPIAEPIQQVIEPIPQMTVEEKESKFGVRDKFELEPRELKRLTEYENADSINPFKKGDYENLKIQYELDQLHKELFDNEILNQELAKRYMELIESSFIKDKWVRIEIKSIDQLLGKTTPKNKVKSPNGETIPSEVQSELNRFADSSRELSSEKMIWIDENGERIYTKNGKKDAVEFDKDMAVKLREKYGELHIDHNHPCDKKGETPTCLSMADTARLLDKTPNGDYIFKSITAEHSNGHRMTISKADDFSDKDVAKFNELRQKMVDEYNKVLDEYVDKPREYVDEKCDRIYEETGKYPGLDEIYDIQEEAKQIKKEILDSYHERLEPIQKAFKECNIELKVEWVE